MVLHVYNRTLSLIGSTLGAYRILEKLGEGGMGEVYRAQDDRLKRSVALKVLPDAFAHDADRVERFQREAEVLASLNHPHIGAIYDLAREGDVRFLVLELVDGDTLADRLSRGPLSLALALEIARQVATALEAAHARGIVHRDLKPANIKIASDGKVKVLDFGLAKMRAGYADSGDTVARTALSMTAVGVIVGTAAYMSPEQASGEDTDKSTDIWAFGCVLYEMVTARPVFEGQAVSEILRAVLAREPDWTRLPAGTPEAVRRLLRRCLQRDRSLRLHDLADARIEIADAIATPEAEAPVASAGVSKRERAVWMIGAALLALVTLASVTWALRPSPPPLEVRLDVSTPQTIELVSFALSPDGRQLAFAGESDGRPRLWLRSLDSPVARLLADTDFATYPFWSPDGQSIGFFADGRLKRLDLAGGAPRVIARVSNPRGGTWMANGTIVYGEDGPLLRVPSSGGEPTLATQLKPQQQAHRFPHALPGGGRFLYYAVGASDARGVYVGSLDGAESRRVLDSETIAVYSASGSSASGHLLFARGGTLVAQAFNADSLALSGEPFPVAEQVARQPLSIQVAAVAASAGGPVAYRAGEVGIRRAFQWFDRSGAPLAIVGEPGSFGQNPNLAPDGFRMAVDRTVSGNVDIWVTDIRRGLPDRFTSDPTIDAIPVWSPDGRHLAFGSVRQGPMDLYARPSSGAASEDVLLTTPTAKGPTDWSPDGRFLLYRSTELKTGYDLWALPLDANRKPGTPFVVAQSAFDERDGVFSPDGRWVAYESNESDRSEVYVQRFPTSEGKKRVSAAGGAQVRWSRDGRELFYLALDGKLMSVPVRMSAEGGAIDVGTPVALFATRVGGALQGAARQTYVVSADGQRFLMNTIAEEAPRPITMILNWRAERN